MADEKLYEVTGYVGSTAQNNSAFKLEPAKGYAFGLVDENGQAVPPPEFQWINLSKDQRSGEYETACPEWKSIVTVRYTVSPPKGTYDRGYWAKFITNPNGTAQPTPTSQPNPYEAKAQELEAAEQAQNAAPAHSGAIARFTDRESSIQMQVCIKAVVEAQLGNLSAAVSHPETDSRAVTITPQGIAADAEELYEAVFVTGPQPYQGEDNDPGPEGP